MNRYLIRRYDTVKLYETKEHYCRGWYVNIDGAMCEVLQDLSDFRLSLEDNVFTEITDFEHDVDIDPETDNVECGLADELWEATAKVAELMEKYKLWLLQNN